MKNLLAIATLMLLLTSCAMPSMPSTPPGADDSSGAAPIRLSEELYAQKAPTAGWQPYFSSEEPAWPFKINEPWASFADDDGYSGNQAPGIEAHESLYPYLSGLANYGGCYINANGYLTVLLTNPSLKQAREIGERSAAPLWITAAEYPLDTLAQARDETFEAVLAWIGGHPDVPAALGGAGVNEVAGRVEISLCGSGVPRLLSAFDVPDYVDFLYTPTIDASLSHEIPHEPRLVWKKEGAVIKNARESYPVGTEFLLVTASHDVAGQRLYAPDSLLKVEKYAEGEWYDISGDFVMTGVYFEIFDIPAGVEKTVQMSIVTPETLGPGLYRATYTGHVCLSPSGDTTIRSAITGVQPDDHVNFEFTVTADAEPLPPRDVPPNQ